MVCGKTQYFNLNRVLLLGVGLWPYQRSILVRFQLFLFFGILISYVIFQLTTFITTECTQDIVISVLSFTSFFIMFLIKYNAFLINIQTIKHLLEILQHTYNELKDENEIAIIEKYGNNARLFTVGLILIHSVTMFICISHPTWPLILDIILPINESRPHVSSFIMSEYFIDEEKYFYLIQLHLTAAYCVGSTVMIATGAMLMAYFKHTCGMFRIASYRIEHATMNVVQNISLENEIVIYKEIIQAVDIHRKAMKYIKFLVSNFEIWFLLLILVTVASLSFNLFHIFQLMLFGDFVEVMLYSLHVCALISYMFLANYAGQEVTDHNAHIFYTMYNVRWYEAPLRIQKLMLFLLQMGSKAFSLNIGGVFVGSLETFATLASASITYFTVLYSMQQ